MAVADVQFHNCLEARPDSIGVQAEQFEFEIGAMLMGKKHEFNL